MKTKVLVKLSSTTLILTAVLGLLACSMPFSSNLPPTGTNKVTTLQGGVQQGYVFVANQGDDSLSTFSIDPSTGELSAVGPAMSEPNRPTWVAVDPVGHSVYATNSSGVTGSVSAYALDESTGVLTPVGAPAPAGGSPLGVAVYPGHFAFAANNGHGVNTISAYTIDPASGALASVGGSPFATQSWPGGISVYASGGRVYASNFDSKSVTAYSIDATSGALSPVGGSLAAASSAVPSGPRHLAVYEPGAFVYVVNGGSVTAYAINSTDGSLAPAAATLKASTYPSGSATFAYAVAVCSQYGYVYVTNPNDNTITGYAIQPGQGTLTPVNATTAASSFPTGGNPRGISVLEGGRFLYVANSDDSTVSAYAIDPATGTLSPVTGSLQSSTYPAGKSPDGLAVYASLGAVR